MSYIKYIIDKNLPSVEEHLAHPQDFPFLLSK